MKNWQKFLGFFLFVMMLCSGCKSNSSNATDDLFQYKDSYVGDNSAVGNIVHQLPGAEDLINIELETKEEPFGIILNYSGLPSENRFREMVMYNGTFLFTLIQNVDWVTFNFDSLSITIQKEQFEEAYSQKLSKIEKESEVKELISDFLEDESKVKALLVQSEKK